MGDLVTLASRREPTEADLDRLIDEDATSYQRDPQNKLWDGMLEAAELLWSFRDIESLSLLQAKLAVVLMVIQDTRDSIEED